jgi:hypothetical protein
VPLQPLAVGFDLTDPILARQHRQNRFVLRPPQDLDSTDFDQHPQTLEVLGMPFGQPHHQRARCVQRQLQLLVRLEDLQEWKVAILICLLEHTIKIANRLMVMKNEA